MVHSNLGSLTLNFPTTVAFVDDFIYKVICSPYVGTNINVIQCIPCMASGLEVHACVELLSYPTSPSNY